jgi:hypothetical protein
LEDGRKGKGTEEKGEWKKEIEEILRSGEEERRKERKG